MIELINNLKEACDMLNRIDNGNLSMGYDGCHYYFDDALVKVLKEDIKSYYENRVKECSSLLKEQL